MAEMKCTCGDSGSCESCCNQPSYIARAECGCIKGAIVADSPKETARFVSGFIKSGLSIEQLTAKAVRSARWVCEAHRKA